MTAIFDHTGRWRTAGPGEHYHPQSQAGQPWGLRQMRPFTDVEVEPAYRAVVDGETQLTRYLDETGQPIELGKHRRTERYTEKRDSTRTKPQDNQGPNDSDTDNSTVLDGSD
jgi:putative ATP-grasp target RiPP